jgi:IS5 family transposase
MRGKQLGFSDYVLTTAKKQTKREKFLAEMEVVVPWHEIGNYERFENQKNII